MLSHASGHWDKVGPVAGHIVSSPVPARLDWARQPW